MGRGGGIQKKGVELFASTLVWPLAALKMSFKPRELQEGPRSPGCVMEISLRRELGEGWSFPHSAFASPTFKKIYKIFNL